MITQEQLCKHLSQYNGEEVDSLKQVAKITFSGGELLEFINSLPAQIEQFCDFEHHNADVKLIAAAPAMYEALQEITEGKGRYDTDKLKHASNTIEDMIKLAKDAISTI